MYIKYTSILEATTGLKSISLSKKNMLALGSGEEEDWLLLYQVDAQFNLNAVPIGKMEKRLISQLAWSPNGQYLATAYDKLIIWNGNNLNILRTYQGHELEITAMCWAPDDCRLATASLDGKIFIYNITQEGIQHKIDCAQKTVGLCWDPFDKYLVCLKFDNTVNFYKLDNLKLEISVSLQIQGKQSTSKKEDRKLDWSIDCRYLAVPNLDDKVCQFSIQVIPTVAILDRNQDFQVIRTIMGPFSSINVVKFSPILFKYNQEYCNIFAVGDNDGNISFWRINDTITDEKPFLLIKGHKKAGELIEDLTWNSQGNVLMATTSKKYIIILNFSNSLGTPLTDQEKQQTIKTLYGDLKNTIKQIRIYQPNNSIQKVNDMQLEQLNNRMPEQLSIEQREIPKSTQFKQIIENGKKKLIPLDIVEQTKKVESNIMLPLLLISQYEVLPKSYSFQLNSKILLLEVQKQQKSFNQYGTLIRCMENDIIQWVDYVEGQVKTIQYNKEIILIYTDQSLLYIEDHKGMRKEAPFVLPFLSQIVLSNMNHILCLSNSGEFKVIDLKNKIISYEGDIKILMQHVYEWMDKKQLLNDDEKKGKISVDPLIKSNIKIDADNYPIVEFLFKDYCVYTFNKHLRQWVKTKQIDANLQNQDIKQLKKFNFVAYQIPIQNDATIYKRLIQKNTIEDAISDIQQISKLEEQLKQFQYNDEIQSYLQVLQLYIKKLCDNWPTNPEKLTSIIMIINDEKSPEYEYLNKRTDIQELKQRIIYIFDQFPQTRDVRMLLFPDDL